MKLEREDQQRSGDADGGKKEFFQDPKFQKLLWGILVLVLGYFGYKIEVDPNHQPDIPPAPFEAPVTPLEEKEHQLPAADLGKPGVFEEEGSFSNDLVTSLVLPPDAKITGPSAGEVGDILILNATESIGDFYAWTVKEKLPDGRTTIKPIENREGKETQCQVASVAGTYTVTLGVSNEKGISLTTWVVTVRGPPKPDCPECPEPNPDPKPEPEPDPGPDPKPDPGPDLSDKAQEVYDILKPVGLKAGEAKAVAGIIRNVIFLAATHDWDVNQLKEEYKKYFLATVPESSKQKWQIYMEWQGAEFKPIEGDREKVINLLDQVAQGLEAI